MNFSRAYYVTRCYYNLMFVPPDESGDESIINQWIHVGWLIDLFIYNFGFDLLLVISIIQLGFISLTFHFTTKRFLLGKNYIMKNLIGPIYKCYQTYFLCFEVANQISMWWYSEPIKIWISTEPKIMTQWNSCS